MTNKTERFIDYVIKRGLEAIHFDNELQKIDMTKTYQAVLRSYFNGNTLDQTCKKYHVNPNVVRGWMEEANHAYHGLYPIAGKRKYSHLRFMWLNYHNPKSKYYHVLPWQLVEHFDLHGIHTNDPYIDKAYSVKEVK